MTLKIVKKKGHLNRVTLYESSNCFIPTFHSGSAQDGKPHVASLCVLSLCSILKSDLKKKWPVAYTCMITVLLPLGKLKPEKTTTRTFVQSRSSMGEQSVGSTHRELFTEREREYVLSNSPFCSLSFLLQSRSILYQRIRLIQVTERLNNQPMIITCY